MDPKTTPPDLRQPCQVGYEAYGLAAQWKTFDGRPMPTWQQLGETPVGQETQRRWAVAAEQILAHGSGPHPIALVGELLETKAIAEVLVEQLEAEPTLAARLRRVLDWRQEHVDNIPAPIEPVAASPGNEPAGG